MRKKRIAILGSTGSIGINALDVLSRLGSEFEVIGLSARSNIELLSRQARIFKARAVCVGTGELAGRMKRLVPSGTAILTGGEGLKEMASRGDVDILLLAITGMAALVPLVEAVNSAKRIALANKEALVSAGELVMGLAKKNGAGIVPVDSEHSAIFQCLDGRRESLSKIYLTGSGGPLLNVRAGKFDSLSMRYILKHPKWKMGEKITVDSATMMNKGLEIIEAQYLFGVPEDRIEVLIHPEAIIHSMVEFADGAVLAQLAAPDMRIPIQYALTYPERKDAFSKSVDFSKIGSLTFRRPDTKKFPSLELARSAARSMGTASAALCAADEEAVSNYLNGKIKFSDITRVAEKVLSRHKNAKEKSPSIGDILGAAEWAKEEARSICCH
ncbi:MAG: 1-deoxy-D-xylulose-5-phosphate reductoisomerase [Candidatus Omnitrophota bacterium]|nr:1-deoxy-D-xylulose-5-phosphate reductoisomerase [Candidatus Omnitrophota bacterium]